MAFFNNKYDFLCGEVGNDFSQKLPEIQTLTLEKFISKKHHNLLKCHLYNFLRSFKKCLYFSKKKSFENQVFSSHGQSSLVKPVLESQAFHLLTNLQPDFDFIWYNLSF